MWMIRTKIVSHEALVLQGMLWTNGNQGLASLHGLITLRPTSGLPPFQFLFQNMEHGNYVV